MISDKNDFRRNEKVCKMLTAKYCLHFANGKDHIKEERLRPYDKAKHEIYKALKEELPKVHSWEDLKDVLADRDIDMKFKVSRTSREIQGVKFEHNGFSFSGSKEGREFSYLNIDNRLEENACASLLESAKQEPIQQKEEVLQSVSHSGDGFDLSLGLLNGSSSYDATATEEAEFNRLMKRKKLSASEAFIYNPLFISTFNSIIYGSNNLYLYEKFGYRESSSVMQNANGFCVDIREPDLDCYIRFW